MSKDQYIKWEPIQNIPLGLYLKALHHDNKGFRILLKDAESSRILRITFELPLAYRNLDEGSLLMTLAKLRKQVVLTVSAMYIVNNSTWVEWFHYESCGIYKDRNVIHYAIYTQDDCIDAISELKPKVEWLE